MVKKLEFPGRSMMLSRHCTPEDIRSAVDSRICMDVCELIHGYSHTDRLSILAIDHMHDCIMTLDHMYTRSDTCSDTHSDTRSDTHSDTHSDLTGVKTSAPANTTGLKHVEGVGVVYTMRSGILNMLRRHHGDNSDLARRDLAGSETSNFPGKHGEYAIVDNCIYKLRGQQWIYYNSAPGYIFGKSSDAVDATVYVCSYRKLLRFDTNGVSQIDRGMDCYMHPYALSETTAICVDYNYGSSAICDFRIGTPIRLGDNSRDKHLIKRSILGCTSLGYTGVIQIFNVTAYKWEDVFRVDGVRDVKDIDFYTTT